METIENGMPANKPKRKRAIIDTDIHGSAPRDELLQYMLRIYRE
jgi:hypothetical protein